ncbi:MAG TPA: DUF2023 domain-containing protein [Chlorobaculum sp.]|uniref:DUF2023 domain-containing protein n=1 Tax=Chlorobaculum tepidum (strain ATCC 49652 / DSM 12025 / NBRC 103806 / TLS) TaxID=194439 RepID=Q8KBQ0_CHLTE|nr:DUF2023 family protein [Chlorobaculum tepidum]AAM72957.1 hypothetical protein CT1735 [Chlorobaculum tepidum TLS]HBU24404.1 DUF2023 domain-containing protein [Chlorobaculum sp.]
MKVLIHHIYEYRKGLRSLVMHTLPARFGEEATRKLRHYGIDYHIYDFGKSHINVFFGAPECVAVVRSICASKKLKALTPEEDFVLGSMLGYDIRKQCERYLKKCESAAIADPAMHKCA